HRERSGDAPGGLRAGRRGPVGGVRGAGRRRRHRWRARAPGEGDQARGRRRRVSRGQALPVRVRGTGTGGERREGGWAPGRATPAAAEARGEPGLAERGRTLTASRIVRLATVDSTQAVAFDVAARGAPDGTVVVAEHQTGGRGRRGRRWTDEPGASLLLS